jgi:hypothetical protein
LHHCNETIPPSFSMAKSMVSTTIIALCDPASLSGDDSALPDEERVVLERAQAVISRLAERAQAGAGVEHGQPVADGGAGLLLMGFV